MITCTNHRTSAPIRSAEAAIHSLHLVTDSGREAATIVACLDHNRRPLTMFIIDGPPPRPEHVEQAFRLLIEAIGGADSDLAHVFLGSSRPGGVTPDADDAYTWWRICDLGAKAGVSVLDWFVLSDGTAFSMAELAGETPAW